MPFKRRMRSRWPPPPCVEEEIQSLSRELHGLANLGEDPGVEGVCSRGTIDQYPLIVTLQVVPLTIPPTISKPLSMEELSRGNSSSDDSAGPPTPSTDVKKEPMFYSVNSNSTHSKAPPRPTILPTKSKTQDYVLTRGRSSGLQAQPQPVQVSRSVSHSQRRPSSRPPASSIQSATSQRSDIPVLSRPPSKNPRDTPASSSSSVRSTEGVQTKSALSSPSSKPTRTKSVRIGRTVERSSTDQPRSTSSSGYQSDSATVNTTANRKSPGQSRLSRVIESGPTLAERIEEKLRRRRKLRESGVVSDQDAPDREPTERRTTVPPEPLVPTQPARPRAPSTSSKQVPVANTVDEDDPFAASFAAVSTLVDTLQNGTQANESPPKSDSSSDELKLTRSRSSTRRTVSFLDKAAPQPKPPSRASSRAPSRAPSQAPSRAPSQVPSRSSSRPPARSSSRPPSRSSSRPPSRSSSRPPSRQEEYDSPEQIVQQIVQRQSSRRSSPSKETGSRSSSPVRVSRQSSPAPPGLCLLPCSRTIPVAGLQDWYTIRGLTHLDICPSCMNQISKSEFRDYFIPSGPKPRGQKVRCSFSEPWVRLAWVQTVKKQHDNLDMLYQITRPSSSNKPCPGRIITDQHWYRVVDPDTGSYLPKFNVCGACIRNLRVLMPSHRESFKRSTATQERACDFVSDSPRFIQYIDLLDMAANRAASEGSSRPELDDFLAYARRKVVLRDCRRDRVILSTWHYMRQLPELTVCEDCYDDVVWPLVKAKQPIARKFSTSMRLLPGEDSSQCGEASCQLYSPRIRAKFREAVQKNDLTYLKLVGLRRYEAEQRFRERRKELVEDQKRGFDCDLEFRENMEEWKKWE